MTTRRHPENPGEWGDFIFDADVSFEEKAQVVFRFQYGGNEVYRRFVDALGVVADEVTEGGRGKPSHA